MDVVLVGRRLVHILHATIRLGAPTIAFYRLRCFPCPLAVLDREGRYERGPCQGVGLEADAPIGRGSYGVSA